MPGKHNIKFYEFMIYTEDGVLVYFEDIDKNITIDVEKRLEEDKTFKNRM